MNYLFKKKIVIDWNFYELHHYLSMNHNKCHILRWYEWDLPVYCNKHLLVGRYWDFTSCQGKNSLSMYIFTDSYHLIIYFNGTCKLCIIHRREAIRVVIFAVFPSVSSFSFSSFIIRNLKKKTKI